MSTKPVDQPASPTKKGKEEVKHGRRADGTEGAPKPVSGWGEDNQVKKPIFDQTENDNITTLEGETVTDAAAAENHGTFDPHNGLSPEEAEEALQREVAAAPVEYHSAMPKIAELDANAPGGGKWQPMRSGTGDEIDLSCLTSVLVAELDDEDVPWVPELMLVQLTSELFSGDGAAEDGSEDGDNNNANDADADSPNAAGPSALGGGHESSVKAGLNSTKGLGRTQNNNEPASPTTISSLHASQAGPAKPAGGLSESTKQQSNTDLGVSAAGRRRGQY